MLQGACKSLLIPTREAAPWPSLLATSAQDLLVEAMPSRLSISPHSTNAQEFLVPPHRAITLVDDWAFALILS